MNPALPESDPTLRLWMKRLRVAIANDHEHYEHMAAWSLDLYQMHSEGILNGELEFEALTNMAVALSHLGFKKTARSFYERVLAGTDLDPANRAAIEVRLGDHLWSIGDRPGADNYYAAAIHRYDNGDHKTLNDLHNLVRAKARRADSLERRGESRAALDDVVAAVTTADIARGRGAYQAVRSVDAAIKNDLRDLVATIGQLPLRGEHAGSVVSSMLRLGNTSLASWIRHERLRDGAPSSVFVASSHAPAAQESQVQAGARWHAVSDSDVSDILESVQPTLMTMITRFTSSEIQGLTVHVGGQQPPSCRTWSLKQNDDPEQVALLRALLSPPPGSSAQSDSVWGRAWNPDEFRELTENLFGATRLSERIKSHPSSGLRIIPVGTMWRFPFTAIPVENAPLGAITPIVLAPGPSLNLARPRVNHWAAHFDLRLTNAIRELQALLSAAKGADVPVLLFDDVQQLATVAESAPISTLVFSGHGQIRRSVQLLQMADDQRVHASQFQGLARGSSIVLNACWSGSILDTLGSHLVQQSLEYVARGAHSVLGTIGPVSDRHASEFLRGCLPALAAGQSLARAHQTVIIGMSREASLPICAWASHSTIGRHTDFIPEEGETQ